jgi:hypothetical protein
MEKYSLSGSQLRNVLQKLVDAGAIDEMEIFMRTSLSDSIFLSKAFVETQRAVQELDYLEETTPARDSESWRHEIKLEETPTDTRAVGSAIELIQKAFQRSLDAGTTDTTELLTQRRLRSLTVTEDIVETQCAARRLDNFKRNKPSLDLETQEIEIKVKEILSDIRRRASDFELMSKYGLSPQELDTTLESLVTTGVLRPAELDERGGFFDDPANRSQTRRCPRAYLWRPLTIEDLTDPANRGLLTDLSVMGFRTRRIGTSVGEEKSFAIHAREFVGDSKIDLSAACKWCATQGPDRKLWVAGFQIIDVPDDDLKRIRRIIALFGSKDSDVVLE